MTAGSGDVADPIGRPDFDTWALASHRRLHRLAWLLCGDRGRAEDLTRETLWRMYRAWKRIDDPRAVHAYARTTMVRLARRRRARRWTGETPTDQERLAEVADPEADPTERIDDALRVTRVLAALPDAERDVLVLRYFEDCSEAEIASLLGCAPGTVKSRASRALTRLRAEIGPGFDDPGSAGSAGPSSTEATR